MSLTDCLSERIWKDPRFSFVHQLFSSTPSGDRGGNEETLDKLAAEFKLDYHLEVSLYSLMKLDRKLWYCNYLGGCFSLSPQVY